MDKIENWLSEFQNLSSGIYGKATSAEIHRSRSRTLATRVKIIVESIVSQKLNFNLNDTMVRTHFTLLLATLEEISDYFKILQTKDSTLGKRVKRYGSDEEMFIKWNETLQTCCAGLNAAAVTGLFDSTQDLQDFNQDMEELKSNLQVILEKILDLFGSVELAVEANRKLLEEQQNDRTMYKTQQAVKAEKSFDPKLIRYEKIIGTGGFGEVWKARYKSDYVAIKKVPSKSLSDEAKILLKQEAEFMKKLSHPRIVSCLGILETKGNYCMVMELCVNGSLNIYMLSNQSFTVDVEKRTGFVIDIATGMNYLHKLGVIHRDLKLGNVVLDEHDRAKITDFGLSVIKSNSQTSMKLDECGTPQYMAPESFGLVPIFSTKSDVYAFAIVLWELSHWMTAYKQVSTMEIKDSIKFGDRLPISNEISLSTKTLISDCWNQNPRLRPSFAQILDRLNNPAVDFTLDAPSSARSWFIKKKPRSPSTNGPGKNILNRKKKELLKKLIIAALLIFLLLGISFGVYFSVANSNKAVGNASNSGFTPSSEVPITNSSQMAGDISTTGYPIHPSSILLKKSIDTTSFTKTSDYVSSISSLISAIIASSVIYSTSDSATAESILSSSSTILSTFPSSTTGTDSITSVAISPSPNSTLPSTISLSTAQAEATTVSTNIPTTTTTTVIQAASTTVESTTIPSSSSNTDTVIQAAPTATVSTSISSSSSTTTTTTIQAEPTATVSTSISSTTTTGIIQAAPTTVDSTTIPSSSSTITTTTIQAEPTANVSTLIKNDALLKNVYGITIDSNDNLYVILSPSSQPLIYKININNPNPPVLVANLSTDGQPTVYDEQGICQFNNSLYIPRMGQLTKIDLNTNLITRFAGTGTYTPSTLTDGPNSTATFCGATMCTTDNYGNIYVGEICNAIRKVDQSGYITTVVSNLDSKPFGMVVIGSDLLFTAWGPPLVYNLSLIVTGQRPSVFLGNALDPQPRIHKDGSEFACQFQEPGGIGVDGQGNLFIIDSLGTIITRSNTTNYVSTFAGAALYAGYQDGVGTPVRFGYLRLVVFDSKGRLFAADESNNAIRMISW